MHGGRRDCLQMIVLWGIGAIRSQARAEESSFTRWEWGAVSAANRGDGTPWARTVCQTGAVDLRQTKQAWDKGSE